jgi:predicted nucleic acid-binding protein
MTLAHDFSAYSRLYVDTAPFIYFTESRPRYVDAMRSVFTYVSKDQLQIITASVTIPEAISKPLQLNDVALVQRFRNLFFRTQGVQVASILPTTGDLAAELRAQYRLHTADALHIACAIESGCEAFLTNDNKLSRVTVIPVLLLDDII